VHEAEHRCRYRSVPGCRCSGGIDTDWDYRSVGEGGSRLNRHRLRAHNR
jgi:hypothetical protein